MAIDRASAEALALLPTLKLPFKCFLMLGRQHLALSQLDWQRLEESGAFAGIGSPISRHREDDFADEFLRELGADMIHSMDFSDYQGCDLVHDLNQPVPEEWHQRYDVVFDGGTLEHVFHFPNAVANAMALVAEGGCLVTCTTANNYNGHGFYQFSPELFFRLFDADNGFHLHLLALAETTGARQLYQVDDPKTLGHRVTFGGRGPTLLIAIAERRKIVPLFRDSPQQSDYESAWSSETAAASGDASESFHGNRRFKNIVRSMVPTALLESYRRHQFEQRLLTSSRRGVRAVSSLRECLRPS